MMRLGMPFCHDLVALRKTVYMQSFLIRRPATKADAVWRICLLQRFAIAHTIYAKISTPAHNYGANKRRGTTNPARHERLSMDGAFCGVAGLGLRYFRQFVDELCRADSRANLTRHRNWHARGSVGHAAVDWYLNLTPADRLVRRRHYFW